MVRTHPWEVSDEWWGKVQPLIPPVPFGKDATGPNPTDRGKRGTKRSLLTDGAGIPLAFVVDEANRHDVRLLCVTLDGILMMRPEPTEEHPQHLCLDAGYSLTFSCSTLLTGVYQ